MRYVIAGFLIFSYTMLILSGVLDPHEFNGIVVPWLCLCNYCTAGSVSDIYVLSDIKSEETLR